MRQLNAWAVLICAPNHIYQFFNFIRGPLCKRILHEFFCIVNRYLFIDLLCKSKFVKSYFLKSWNYPYMKEWYFSESLSYYYCGPSLGVEVIFWKALFNEATNFCLSGSRSILPFPSLQQESDPMDLSKVSLPSGFLSILKEDQGVGRDTEYLFYRVLPSQVTGCCQCPSTTGPISC